MGWFGQFFGGSERPKEGPPALLARFERAMNGLRALTEAHDGLWQIGQAAWDVDQEEGTITFTSPEGMTATAPVQFIGSYNSEDGVWLWAWANPSVRPGLAQDAAKARAFGEAEGYEALTTPRIACTELRCWELTALACELAGAQGAYRGPAGPLRIFMTFGDVRLAKTPGASGTRGEISNY